MFNLHFLAEKIKIGGISDVLAEIELKTTKEYLFGIKNTLFFHFYRGSYKVQCSLDNPKYLSLIKEKKSFGSDT